MAQDNMKMKIVIDGDNKGFKKSLNQTSRDIKQFEQETGKGSGGGGGNKLSNLLKAVPQSACWQRAERGVLSRTTSATASPTTQPSPTVF